jgi:hypothetical protein
MAREEIIEKLDDFLNHHDPLTEECHVVYLMVEIRKILDHEKDHRQTGDFSLLRFYCDWILHTEKTGITENIRLIMEEVFKDAKSHIEAPAMQQEMSPVMQFAYMNNLKEQMVHFLEERGLNSAIVNDGWISFIGILVKVLENQPINDPTDDISVFSFIPAAEGCVAGVIYFKKPINGYNHYKFANAY